MSEDSAELREILTHLFPDLIIESAANKSGQRVVYFCHFNEKGLARDDEPPWSSWGRVVMKVSEGISTRTIAYMQMEIEVLNNMDSRYFPKLYWNDVFAEDPLTDEKLKERLFISIETYVESKPLSQCLASYENEAKVIKLLIELVEGASLLWLHEKRLVHRDLKPDNILIQPDGTPVIIDLGIMRETGAAGLTLTEFGGPMTVNYASPEQIKYDKKAISFKTDLFSLATIAYELLSGNHPYARADCKHVHDICNNIISLTPPSLYGQGIASREFSMILEKMMEKEPYRRYRSIEKLKEDLKNALGAIV